MTPVRATRPEALAGSLRDASPGAIAVDVFDTCLLRRTTQPRLAHAMSPPPGLSRPTWTQVRCWAEESLLADSGDAPVTLPDVYARVAGIMGWSPAQRTEQMCRELEALRQSLRPDEAVRETLAGAHEHGVPVCYLARTLISADVVRELLDQHHFPAGPVLTAHPGTGSWKRDPRIAGALAVPAGQVVHVGRQAEQTEQTDRRSAAPQDNPSLTAGEQQLAATGTLGGLLAEASRVARQELSGRDEVHDPFLFPLGLSFVIAATTWSLLVAQQRQLTDLYFVARDGQLPLRVAPLLREAVDGAEVGLHYVYGSRYAWCSDDPVQVERMRRYYDRVGLLRRDVGVLDIGWTGSSARQLEVVLQQPLSWLYLGGLAGVAPGRHPSDATTYLVDERLGPIGWREAAYPTILEAICAGTEGTLRGFDESDEPVLSPVPEHSAAVALRHDAVARAAKEFARSLRDCAVRLELSDIAALGTVLDEQFEGYWRRPSKAQAHALGSLPWESRKGEVGRSEIAPVLGGRDFRERMRGHLHLAWPTGSLARTVPGWDRLTAPDVSPPGPRRRAAARAAVHRRFPALF